MANKEKNTGLGIPQTRGSFQLKGVVTGTSKDSCYKETTTKTQKPWRTLNFGLKTEKDSTLYLTLSDGEKEKVYFSKSETVDGKKKTDVQEVAWKDRFKFNKEGYRLIGVNVGVAKIKDAKGNDVNDKKILTGYDATKEIYDNLKDDESVFVKGNIEYSHFEGKNGATRATKFIPSQVSLCKSVDFDEEGFVPTSEFTQIIVFTGIKQDEEDKSRFVLSAKIVNFNSVEDAEFYITQKDLATTFKKNLKPYTALKVWGNIHVAKDVEEVIVSDCWGEENAMDKINTPTKRELIITGADPKTIDTTTYTEEIIEQAIAKANSSKKAENEFGKGVSDEWGNSGSSSNAEDDEPW